MKKRYRRTSASQYVYVALIIISIVAVAILSSFMMQRITFSDHFVIPWTAGRNWLLQGVNPYDVNVLSQAEKTIDQSSYLSQLPDPRVLIEPVINLIFYLPFSLIPYEISRAIWVTFLILTTGLIGYISLKLSGWKVSVVEKISLLLFSLFWLPGVNAVIQGRLSPIVILFVLLSIHWIVQEQDTRAGFILALTFGSLPTTGLVIPVLLIWGISRRRWSIFKAYFAGIAFLIFVTLLLLPSWPLNWLQTVYDIFGNWDWIRTPLMQFAGILPGIANFLSIFLHAALGIYFLVLLITLMGKTKRVFIWKVLAMLVVAYLFHVKASSNQLFLVLPAMFMVFRFWSERWRLYGRILAWIVLISILAVSWLLIMPELAFDSALSLPLLSIGLPLLIFMGMIWIRWWAFNILDLPFEP